MPAMLARRDLAPYRLALVRSRSAQQFTSRILEAKPSAAKSCRDRRIPRQSAAPQVFGEAPIDDHIVRCGWAGSDPLYVAYHDQEWGVSLHDERALFEMLILEGFQAGLSWITILRKRDNFRRAFDRFDPARVAAYDANRIAALLADPGIVRNRAKIEGAVASARAYLDLAAEPGGAARFLWQFVGGRPILNRRRSLAEVPAETPEARAMSKALKQRGFKFCGPTICYAFMQAVGMVDDHVVDCFRHGVGATAGRAG
jgi:DNA-3-methyladenine glycosylase I